ncbi:hypothetical protein Nepgr_008232 [Nepenthes gracilis]|uniref:Uncharacterized protein n=1 Tax=Nepenthes gracilis TaxID=150966 RepID=A0AAD3S953_NEPGR|nr:hypothetical protein Nepgr_008232 [Nepenthes gracilis]
MVKKTESPSSSRTSRVSCHGVDNTGSVLTTSTIAFLIVDYGIPNNWCYHAPGSTGRTNAPPGGFVTVYENHLRGGLHYLMPCTLYALVEALGVPIARLHPDALCCLVSLYIFSLLHADAFDNKAALLIFRFTESEDWVSVSPKTGFHFHETNPNSVKNWKNRLFFLQDPSDFELPHEWDPISEYFHGKVSSDDAKDTAELVAAINFQMVRFSIQGYFLTSITFQAARWGPPSG